MLLKMGLVVIATLFCFPGILMDYHLKHKELSGKSRWNSA